jgi:uncharacterized protein YggT (Ycf19 family)
MGIFFVVLEIIVLFYIVQGIFDLGSFCRRASIILVAPILSPMQKLVRRSVMNTFTLDLSPYILLIVLYYLERICDYLIA